MEVSLLSSLQPSKFRYKFYEGINGSDQEEILVISKNSVEYKSHYHTYSRYEMLSEVIDAEWCHFEQFSPEINFLCILTKEILYVYSMEGDNFLITLPCEMSNIWHISYFGIILERSNKQNDKLPTLFSLSHPFFEVKPIGKCFEDYFCLESHHICFISSFYSIICTFNGNQSGFHHIWLFKKDSLTDNNTTLPFFTHASRRSSIFPVPLPYKSLESFEDEFSTIKPDIIFYPLWQSDFALSRATTVFHCMNIDYQILLCFFCPNQCLLTAYSIAEDDGFFKFSPVFHLSCSSCVPLSSPNISSSPKFIYLLCLSSNGTISLYAGNVPLINISLSASFFPMSQDFKNQISSCLVDISESVLDNFNVVYGSGEQQRFNLSLSWKSELVELSLRCLQIVFPPLLYYKIISIIYNDKESFLKKHESLTEKDEWDLFSNRLLSFFFPSFSLYDSSTPIHTPTIKNNSDWFQLLSSPFHLQYHSENFFHTISLEEPENIQSIPIPNLVKTPHQDDISSQIKPYFEACLFCFHLFYEDCKIYIFSHQFLNSLNSFLQKLSFFAKPDKYNQLHYPYDSVLSRVFSFCSIHQHLNIVLRGGDSIYQLLPSNIDLSLLRSIVWDRSRQICLFYSVLCGKDYHYYLLDNTFSPSSSLPYNQVIECMVHEHFTFKDLQHFNVGISMPLFSCIYLSRLKPCMSWSSDHFHLIQRDDLAFLEFPPNHCSFLPPLEDKDGTLYVTQKGQERFSDLRLYEIRRILRSDRILSVRFDRWAESEAGDGLIFNIKFLFDSSALNELQLLLTNLMSRRLSLPVARGAYTLFSIKPELTRPFPFSDLIFIGHIPPKNIPVTPDHLPSLSKVWTFYHNAISSGLRIISRTSNYNIPRTWLFYNYPHGKDNQQPSVEQFASYAGFLFSLGLNGHIKTLTPADYYSYLAQKNDFITISLLLGSSVCYRETMYTLVSKMLCMHLPLLLPYGYSSIKVPDIIQMSSMVGVGLLYQGSAHRLMIEVLYSELSSRSYRNTSLETMPGLALCAGIGLGLVLLSRGGDMSGVTDLSLPDKLNRLINGGPELPETAEHFNVEEDSNHSCLKAGERINTVITAPGSMIALSFMFLASNNYSNAMAFNFPDTYYLLELLISSTLCLRAICKYLILWDSIVPDIDWILQQLPPILQIKNLNSNPDPFFCRQCYCYIISGLCFVVGLRYAGTQNITAKNCIRHFIIFFRRLRTGDNLLHGFVDRTTIENCLSFVCVSLSLVMSGSGDLSTFQLLRSCHFATGKEIYFGHHQLIHMSLSFLFLGGGEYCFDNSPESAVYLLISLFPVFPRSPEDNSHYLNPLRHFYVLSIASPRFLSTIDLESKQSCSVKVKINFNNQENLLLHTPCLLPVLNTIHSIEFIDHRITLNEKSYKNLFSSNPIFYLLKKTGFSYRDGQASILDILHYHSFNDSSTHNHDLFFSNDVISDKFFLEYYKQFCEVIPSLFFSFFHEICFDDKHFFLPSLLSITQYQNNISFDHSFNTLWLYEFFLISSFFLYGNDWRRNITLFSIDSLKKIEIQLQNYFEKNSKLFVSILGSIFHQTPLILSSLDIHLLTAFWSYFQLPSVDKMMSFLSFIYKEKYTQKDSYSLVPLINSLLTNSLPIYSVTWLSNNLKNILTK